MVMAACYDAATVMAACYVAATMMAAYYDAAMVTAACYGAATVAFCTRGATATPAPLVLVLRRWITLVSLVRRRGLDLYYHAWPDLLSRRRCSLPSVLRRPTAFPRLHQWRAR